MKAIRLVILMVAMAFILYHLFNFNYSDFSWQANDQRYLGIAAMLCVCLAMIFSTRNEARRSKNDAAKK